MNKVVLALATLVLIVYFLFVLPTFSIKGSFYVKKFNATQNEQIIINELEKRHKEFANYTIFCLMGVYGLLAISTFSTRKPKDKKKLKE